MIAELRLSMAIGVLEEFKILDIPLSRFLSGWFKSHPKAGSRDRRILSDLVYSYYRCFHKIRNLEIREKILAAYFLMGYQDEALLGLLPSYEGYGHNEIINSDLSNTEGRESILKKIYPAIELKPSFSWTQRLSDHLNKEDIEYAVLHQPRVFIRVYPPLAKELRSAILEKGIHFEEIEEYCWAFDNRTNINALKQGVLKAAFEIQDYSSQKTGIFFKAGLRSNWWDCCAGGGGKSLLLAQLYPGANLWASDSRYSVLSNLEERFTESGSPTPRTFVQDLLSDENLPVRESFFDGIIYDAPCSGSGTWGRTPERLGNFHESSLTRMVDIQRRIGDKVIPYLKPRGALIYITCSIFKEENEEVVQYLQDRYSLQLENQIYLNGSRSGADILFLARMVKS